MAAKKTVVPPKMMPRGPATGGGAKGQVGKTAPKGRAMQMPKKGGMRGC